MKQQTKIEIKPPLLVKPSDEQLQKLHRETCYKCKTLLYLRVIGVYGGKPLGYIPECPTCGWMDWGCIL